MYHKSEHEFQGVNSDCSGGVFSASSDEELVVLCWFLMLCCNVTMFYKVSAIIYKSGKEKQDVVFHIGVILYT